MLNGQLKPRYNVQIGTESTYIVGYTIPLPPPPTPGSSSPILNTLKNSWEDRLIQSLPIQVTAAKKTTNETAQLQNLR